MSLENFETLSRTFDDWNRGRREIGADDIDPELELHSVILGRVVRGLDGLREWMTEIDARFDEWELKITDYREAGHDSLLALGEIHIRGRDSKVAFDQPMAWLVEFRDGRILRMRMFTGRSDAFDAAGISE